MALASEAHSAVTPELVIGLVTPIGVDAASVVESLTDVLGSEVDYRTQPIHLIDYLASIGLIRPGDRSGIERMDHLIDAGNALRKSMLRRDAFALYAIQAIIGERAKAAGVSPDDSKKWSTIPPQGRIAYVIRSIKRPEEIQLLRRVYGPWLLVISAFAPRKARFKHILEGLVETGKARSDDRDIQHKIDELLDRDARELDNTQFGQDTRRAFSQADLFIDITKDANDQLRRFIRLVFGDRTHTPTRDEYAMFMAKAAALRSSSPGRQVGAIVADALGEVISAGSNEAPSPHGGYEWDNPEHDRRDIAQVEGNTFGEMLRKRELILDTIRRLAGLVDGAEITPSVITDEAKDLIQEGDPEFVERLRQEVLRESEIESVIEYQRTVHAEMAALQNAHRHGTSVDGSTMYTTSFPCHNCAKHILSAGISRVVYVEPYPKSRAKGFYPEAIRVDGENAGDDPILVDPFIGVGPNLFQQLFASVDEDRMLKNGTIKRWKRGSSNLPRLGPGNETLVNPESIRWTEISTLVDIAQQSGSSQPAEDHRDAGVMTTSTDTDSGA